MSLIARYTLDGSAKDSEGSLHGTAVAVTWGPSQLIEGGGEARLDGTASRIDTGVQFTTETAASLPVWFRPGDGAGHLIGQHDGTSGLAIEQTATGKIRLVVNSTTSAEVTVYPGEYHHAVAVYGAGEATLYLDNQAVATVTATVTWPAVPVTIGARADGSMALECDVVDARLYDEVFNANGVAALAASVAAQNVDGQSPAAPSAGLQLFYTMDNIVGDTLKDEAAGNDGTIINATTTPGVFGNALHFNGQNGRVLVGDLPSMDVAQYTISSWVRRSSSQTAPGQILGRDDSSDRVRTWQHRVDNNNDGNGFRHILFDNNNSVIFNEGTAKKIEIGVWYHLVAVIGAGVITLYVDGQVELQSSFTGTPATRGGATAWIGSRNVRSTDPNGQEILHADIEHQRFYDRALSSAEVLDLYNETGVVAGSLVFPHPGAGEISGPAVPAAGYNPTAIPLPNPTAIPKTGRSDVQGTPDTLAPLGWFDQRDGSGRSHQTLDGVVSDPARQGFIEGNTTDENSQPVSRRVRCFERTTGRLVRETWSNQAGYFRFTDLDPALSFTILAHDYSGEFNAVVADNAQPEIA